MELVIFRMKNILNLIIGICFKLINRGDKTRQDKIRPDKTRQDKTSQDRAGQNRTGHNLKALNR